MKAIVNDRYGSPDVLEVREIEKPGLPDGGVLVRVRATSVNAFDWHMLRGKPYFARVVGAVVMSRFVCQRMLPFLSTVRREDLLFLKELIEGRKVTPVIDRTYPLTDTQEAIRYLESGHARGKVVITVR